MKNTRSYSLILAALIAGLAIGAVVGYRLMPAAATASARGTSGSGRGDATPEPHRSTPAAGEAGEPAMGTAASGGYSLFPPELHLGTLREGEARQLHFDLRRPETGRIRLASVKTRCPCLQFVPRPMIVADGEAARLTFNLHTLTLHGDETKRFYVKLLEPEELTLTGTITMHVERVPAKVRLEPAALHCGVVEGRRDYELTLHNLTKRRLTIRKLTATHEGILPSTADDRLTIDSGKQLVIKATLDPARLPQGPLAQQIRIETDLAEHAVIAVPVDGTVR